MKLNQMSKTMAAMTLAAALLLTGTGTFAVPAVAADTGEPADYLINNPTDNETVQDWTDLPGEDPETTSIPAKFRTCPGILSIPISLADADSQLDWTSITASKGLKYKLTSTNYRDYIAYSTISHTPTNLLADNKYSITVQARKKGTYDLSFSVKTGENTQQYTVKVYCYEYPVAKVTVNGKSINLSKQMNMKSGKVKVTMPKGYKITKLEYQTSERVTNADGNVTTKTDYKTFSNGEEIPFITQPDYSHYKYSNNSTYMTTTSESLYDGVTASTDIKITYLDKYTKEEQTRTERVSYSENWN